MGDEREGGAGAAEGVVLVLPPTRSRSGPRAAHACARVHTRVQLREHALHTTAPHANTRQRTETPTKQRDNARTLQRSTAPMKKKQRRPR
eukprot:3864088-Rhodomonas_salina.1